MRESQICPAFSFSHENLLEVRTQGADKQSSGLKFGIRKDKVAIELSDYKYVTFKS